jgi:hypothetical protein
MSVQVFISSDTHGVNVRFKCADAGGILTVRSGTAKPENVRHRVGEVIPTSSPQTYSPHALATERSRKPFLVGSRARRRERWPGRPPNSRSRTSKKRGAAHRPPI